MFQNIWFREINLKVTQSEDAGGKGNTLTTKQIPGFPKAEGAVIKVGVTSNGFLKAFQIMDKITNIETFHNILNSNSNKDCIWTDDWAMKADAFKAALNQLMTETTQNSSDGIKNLMYHFP